MWPNFANVPISHIFLMFFGWISIFLYFRLIFVIKSEAKREFKSTFFYIIRMHAITDILMFLMVELIMRPRKFRIYELISPISDDWKPQLEYFSQTLIKNAMLLGYVVVAFNRFTTLCFYNMSNLLKLIWTPTTMLTIYLLEWLAPCTILIPMFYFTGNHNFSYVLNSQDGGDAILMRADAKFMNLDGLQDFVLTFGCCVLSTACYLAILVHFLQNRSVFRQITPFSTTTSKTLSSTETVILKCAILSFLFFIPNAIKSFVLFFADSPKIINLVTSAWFFTTEIMCISTPWSLILTSKKLRQLVLPGSFFKVRPTQSTHVTRSFGP